MTTFEHLLDEQFKDAGYCDEVTRLRQAALERGDTPAANMWGHEATVCRQRMAARSRVMHSMAPATADYAGG